MMKLTLSQIQSPAEAAEFFQAVFKSTPEAAIKGLTMRMRQGKVFVARRRTRIIAMLCLTPKKPWAIDASYFTRVDRPLYLLSMGVEPSLQGQGVGRRCLREAEKIAATWPADAIRLDAFDGADGAGGFYARCGYREVGRATYRQTPLIYYERLLKQVTSPPPRSR